MAPIQRTSAGLRLCAASRRRLGFRNVTTTDNLVKSGTIRRSHARAANLFRNRYERPAGLGLGQTDLGAPRITSGTAPVGISEMQLFALDGVRQVKKLLNGLYPLVLAVAVRTSRAEGFCRQDAYEPDDGCWKAGRGARGARWALRRYRWKKRSDTRLTRARRPLKRLPSWQNEGPTDGRQSEQELPRQASLLARPRPLASSRSEINGRRVAAALAGGQQAAGPRDRRAIIIPLGRLDRTGARCSRFPPLNSAHPAYSASLFAAPPVC